MEREVSPGIYVIDRSPQRMTEEAIEREALPSVFITDFRNEQKSQVAEKEFALPLPQMVDEMKELANALEHLQRSNEELLEALEIDPNDPDFQLAIKENEELIERKKERHALLDKMVKEAVQHVGALCGSLSIRVGGGADSPRATPTNDTKASPATTVSSTGKKEEEDDGGLYL